MISTIEKNTCVYDMHTLALTCEILMGTLEKKFHISMHPCSYLYVQHPQGYIGGYCLALYALYDSSEKLNREKV